MGASKYGFHDFYGRLHCFILINKADRRLHGRCRCLHWRGRSIHRSGRVVLGSSGIFHDLHGRLSNVRGNFHFCGGWKLSWNSLSGGPCTCHARGGGRFQATFCRIPYTSIGFHELPSILATFYNDQPASGSS